MDRGMSSVPRYEGPGDAPWELAQSWIWSVIGTAPRVETGLRAPFGVSRRNLRMGFIRTDLVHSHVIRSRDRVQNASHKAEARHVGERTMVRHAQRPQDSLIGNFRGRAGDSLAS